MTAAEYDRMVLDNEPLARSVVRSYHRRYQLHRQDPDDVQQTAMLALSRAARGYDPTKIVLNKKTGLRGPVKFGTYATRVIANTLFAEFVVRGGLIRVGAHVYREDTGADWMRALAAKARNPVPLTPATPERVATAARPDAAAEAADELEAARRLLGDLRNKIPDRYYRILFRRYAAGEWFRQIAAAERVSKETARGRVRHALQLARKALGVTPGVTGGV